MALGPVASIVASVGIAGTIAIGALSTWHGGSELTAAKNLILQQADSLGVYHTNEGKLLNQVSTLKSEIKTLEADGSADSTQIASLQADLTTAQNKLTAAQGNGMTLAAAVDTQNAQVDQANADADSLNTTVTANSTVTTSDQASVDVALQPADGGTVAPTPDPTPTPAPSPVIQGTEVDYISATMPVTLTSNQVKLDKDANNNLYLLNVSDYNQQYSLDGTTYNTISSMTDVTTIGTLDSMDGHVLYIKDQNGVVHTFTLMKK